jgi:hypothetical protein
MAGCALGIDPGGDKYFCPNGQRAGESFNNYSDIPADCWENGEKP